MFDETHRKDDFFVTVFMIKQPQRSIVVYLILNTFEFDYF